MKINARTIAAVAAAIMTVCAAPVSAFADAHTDNQTYTHDTSNTAHDKWNAAYDDQTGAPTPSAKVNVALANAPTYTVTIPTDVSFGSELTAQTNEVKVEDVYLEKGEAVKVTVASQNGYKLILDGTDADYAIPYTLTSDKADLDEIITVESGSRENKGKGTAKLTYSIAEGTDVPVAGAYSDILTFNIAVETPAPAVKKIATGVLWKIGEDLDFGDGVYVKSDWSGARVVSGVHTLHFITYSLGHYYCYWDGFGGDYNMNDDGRNGEPRYGFQIKGSGTASDPYYCAIYHEAID